MKTIIFSLFAGLLLSCNSPAPLKKSQKDSLSYKTAEADFKIDTAMKPLLQSPKEIMYWADYSDFFAVYKINEKTFGIAIDLETFDNPMYNLVKPYINDSLFKDETSGIYKSDLLRTKILYKGEELFYVYCRKGRTEAKVTDIWFSYTECISALIFELSEIDTAKYGMPLIASKQKLNLHYQKSSQFDNSLARYADVIKKQIDFPDDIPYEQFAYNDDFILTYKDTFDWYKASEKGPEINSPGRVIFRIKKNYIQNYWCDYLDIIGIPCI